MRSRGEFLANAKYVLIGVIAVLDLVCLYCGSTFAPGLSSADGEGEPGFQRSDPVTGAALSLAEIVYLDAPKSIPVCDLKFSELILCLDRNLIYQRKLKPNVTLMEHYERHCPPKERRYNCLIPPVGYKKNMSPSGGLLAGTRRGKQIFRTLILRRRYPIRIGWL